MTPKNTPEHGHIFLFLRQADLNTNIDDEGNAFYGVSSQYESLDNMIITCSTKVCSFGKQVVEKVEVGGHPVGVGRRGWPACPHFLELPPHTPSAGLLRGPMYFHYLQEVRVLGWV